MLGGSAGGWSCASYVGCRLQPPTLFLITDFFIKWNSREHQFFVVCCCLGASLTVLSSSDTAFRNYSRWCLTDHSGCHELNLVGRLKGKTPYPLYCLSGPYDLLIPADSSVIVDRKLTSPGMSELLLCILIFPHQCWTDPIVVRMELGHLHARHMLQSFELAPWPCKNASQNFSFLSGEFQHHTQ